MNSNNPIDRIRHILSVIDMKQRDLAKYQQQLTRSKRSMKILFEENLRYSNDHTISNALMQKNNIDIIDTNKEYQEAVAHHRKTAQTIEHLENILGNIHIGNIITEIQNNFEST